MDMCQRALESIAVGIEAASADDHVPTAREQPEWTTPNHEIIDLAALRLRDFSVGKSRHRPVVVVAPFALHDAGIADLAPGPQSRPSVAHKWLPSSLPRRVEVSDTGDATSHDRYATR